MGLTNLSTKRQRIAELARTKSGVALSTLHHVLDLEWMREAYRLTRKDGAPGIDGVTAAEYAQNLETNLLDLLERIKSGRYYAPPVRRVYIPKGEGASARPGSWNGAEAQDGSSGNLRWPTHVHVRVSRQWDRRPNNDPGPRRGPPPVPGALATASTKRGGIAWAPEANQISDR